MIEYKHIKKLRNHKMPNGDASKTIFRWNEAGRKDGRETITAKFLMACCGCFSPVVSGANRQSTMGNGRAYIRDSTNGRRQKS